MHSTTVPDRQHRRRRIISIALATVLAIAGIVLVAVACSAQKTPPQPSQAAKHPTMTNAPSSTTPRTSPRPRAGHPPAPRDTRTPGSAAARGPTLGSAIPTSIDIPAIDAHSSLLSLGQNPDGSIQVPPLGKDSKAGWYDNSPSPGQLGPAVILGHIDSKRYGPGIFFKLGALKPGDTITVSRNDQTTAIFQVDKVEEYPKTKFPTQQVYGNLDHAGLRLITCGGSFNPAAHSYDDNIVAYATLISVSHSA